MTRTLHRPHHQAERRRPRLEWLEPRLALSTSSAVSPVVAVFAGPATLGPYLTAVSTSPAPGAVLSSGPMSVSVTFDRPLYPGSYSAFDVRIEKAQPDGSWANLFDT